MTILEDFAIDIYKLANKVYTYQFDIGDSFFEHFGQLLVESGKLKAIVTLDKQETLITINFDITGTVALVCDRSLEPFDYPIDIQERMLYQYGEVEDQLTDEIAIITERTQQINVAQPLYEFIGLAVPMKRLHPKYADEEDVFTEGEIVFSSDTPTSDADEEVDPRWQALKKFKQ